MRRVISFSLAALLVTALAFAAVDAFASHDTFSSIPVPVSPSPVLDEIQAPTGPVEIQAPRSIGAV